MSAPTNNPEIIVCNIKRRFTGVSGTINALIPVQARTLSVGYLGTPIPAVTLAQRDSPERFKSLSFLQALELSRKRLPDGRPRIWHVRRDHEMLLGILLRDFLILMRFIGKRLQQHAVKFSRRGGSIIGPNYVADSHRNHLGF